jgi:hypothetical protein
MINLLHPFAVPPKLASFLRFLALCLTIGSLADLAHCQQSAPHGGSLIAFQDDPVLKAWGENSEVRKCGICHYASGNVFAQRETDFCRFEEAKIWLQGDKHAVSRQRIEPLSRDELAQKKKDSAGQFVGESNLVSYAICQQLGYDLATQEGYASFRDNCLTCHAGYDPKQTRPADDFAKSNQHHPGISCNYCHQQGETSHWVDLHSGFSAKQHWRLLTPHEKEAAGMRDLVDARAQAKLCASCHIGDHERKMFVSHEMYVAGHPPLPSFELQTFVSKMPPHWRDLKSSYDALQDYPQRDAYFAVNLQIPGEHVPLALAEMFWETRTMLLGAVQAAGQSVALIADADTNQHWGDFALYDCASCHHELRLPSLRQQRAASEAPGRPRLLEWPAPLVEVAVQLMLPAKGVQEARSDLLKLVNQTPFGNPTDCSPAARAVGDALEQTGAQLAKSNLRAEQARKIVKLLAHTSDDSLLDYNAARQVIWAIQLVDRELASKGHAQKDSIRASIRELGREAHRTLVSTDLPAGREGSLYAADRSPTAAEQTGHLAAELERMRQYDPQEMRSQLRELRSQLD